ncbi:fimbria/pilus periplasmic chaperone [Enterobacter wuhouensis]|uniref:fimbria/pilus periplasmic chaperone n=1 Tax=Enterobacter wuhouensis TaxID=2529381 RepID=UPI002FD2FA6A
MFTFTLRHIIACILLLTTCLAPSHAAAGGIILGGTRIIYPSGEKQTSLSVRNTSEHSRFLVQSWLENEKGDKTHDFVVTPPLFVSNSGNENSLRIMYTGQPSLTDRETLYYFNAKAIPAVDKNESAERNVLMLAAVTRIKLFVRPAGLTPSVDEAPSMLNFKREGNTVKIENPSPYYITLVNMKTGTTALKDTMISPKQTLSVAIPNNTSDTISYSIINDYGAISPKINKKF